MLTIILCSVLALVVYLFALDEFRDYEIWEGAGSMVIGAVVGLLIAFLIGNFGGTYRKFHQWELRSLKDETSVHGQFFLGCGEVNGVVQDYFYYKCGDSYRGESISIKDAEIIETDTIGQPYVEEYAHFSEDNLWKINGIFSDCHFIFHLPKGSISTNYSLGK